MTGFRIYSKMTEKELRDSAAEAVPQIEAFFAQNPKRRVCRTELWYGKAQSIKKKNVADQLTAVIDKMVEEGDIRDD